MYHNNFLSCANQSCECPGNVCLKAFHPLRNAQALTELARPVVESPTLQTVASASLTKSRHALVEGRLERLQTSTIRGEPRNNTFPKALYGVARFGSPMTKLANSIQTKECGKLIMRGSKRSQGLIGHFRDLWLLPMVKAKFDLTERKPRSLPIQVGFLSPDPPAVDSPLSLSPAIKVTRS
jgi:hypothetical protein